MPEHDASPLTVPAISRRTALAGLAAAALAVTSRRVTVAASEAATVPTSGHPIVGVWAWENDPDHPGSNLSYVTFDDDGGYIEYSSYGWINFGTWTPTGQRSVDLVTVAQKPVAQDRSTTDYITGGIVFEPVQDVWRMRISVDEAGNVLTAKGSGKAYDETGVILGGSDYDGGARRMVIAPAETPAA